MLLVAQAQIEIRPAREDDLAKIIELVETHDEDDAEAVRPSLLDCRFEHHYVALHDNIPVGISGYYEVPDCDRTYYLSWTYVHSQHCGRGIGRRLIQHVLDKIQEMSARKIFVKISDYVDPEDGPVYAKAMQLYKNMGFKEELVLTDYYDTQESMHILGMRLNDQYLPAPQKPEKPNLLFDGLFLIDETEYSYSFSWRKTSWWKSGFGVQELQTGLDAAYDEGAHQVFLSFPSTFEKITQVVQRAGFNWIGKLEDYYEDGIHENHFVFDFRKK